MWHAWERKGKYAKYWWESRKERDDLDDQSVDRRMGSEWILGRMAVRVWLNGLCKESRQISSSQNFLLISFTQ
jgi:hypothetical protein